MTGQGCQNRIHVGCVVVEVRADAHIAVPAGDHDPIGPQSIHQGVVSGHECLCIVPLRGIRGEDLGDIVRTQTLNVCSALSIVQSCHIDVLAQRGEGHRAVTMST